MCVWEQQQERCEPDQFILAVTSYQYCRDYTLYTGLGPSKYTYILTWDTQKKNSLKISWPSAYRTFRDVFPLKKANEKN
jgi:hypothetical protein